MNKKLLTIAEQIINDLRENNFIVIGGLSCSGKTTICRYIKDKTSSLYCDVDNSSFYTDEIILNFIKNTNENLIIIDSISCLPILSKKMTCEFLKELIVLCKKQNKKLLITAHMFSDIKEFHKNKTKIHCEKTFMQNNFKIFTL